MENKARKNKITKCRKKSTTTKQIKEKEKKKIKPSN